MAHYQAELGHNGTGIRKEKREGISIGFPALELEPSSNQPRRLASGLAILLMLLLMLLPRHNSIHLE
jgi:hypothetical protein